MQKGWNMANERRLVPRASIICRITVMSGLKILVFNADVQNIGEGGIRVILREKLAFGTPVSIEIFPKDTKLHIQSRGEVIWDNPVKLEKSGPVVFDTGIKFTHINEQSRNEIGNMVNLFLTREGKK